MYKDCLSFIMDVEGGNFSGTEEEFVLNVIKFQNTLSCLQGSWQRTVWNCLQYAESEGISTEVIE